jgi:trehalose synthase
VTDDGLVRVQDYEQYIGAEAVERILKKARPLRGMHIAHVNSTYYGGGVAELLSSLSLLMNTVGIKTGWRTIQGSPDFFSITKKMHNALQGGEINLSDRKKEIYEEVVYHNSVRNHLDHDMVIVHDPQPVAMIRHYAKKGPWIWRCHVDLTEPAAHLWDYLLQFVEMYDAVILTLEEYAQRMQVPQVFILPTIDPFSIKNRQLSEKEQEERLSHYRIRTDLPLVTQVSRFDRWKDPEGVIRAVELVRKDVDCTLVLLGNAALDDPEGHTVYESLLKCQDERTFVVSHQDTALVNALQCRSQVVVQKSLREGFGLTVTEAMWKGTPVVGGNVGGIPHQIRDGENGFLVSSVEEAAARITQLLKDKDLRMKMGREARETVKKRFLMVRHLEDYLDLFNSFETVYRLKDRPAARR